MVWAFGQDPRRARGKWYCAVGQTLPVKKKPKGVVRMLRHLQTHRPRKVFLRTALLCGVGLAACGAGDMSLRATDLADPPKVSDATAPIPQELKVTRQPVAPSDEPSLALEVDGDYRTEEPGRHFTRRDLDEELHPLVMPLVEAAYPRLHSTAKGSISVGTVTTGFLVDGASFEEEGPTHRILAKIVDRQTNYTTDEMHDVVLCASKAVAKEFPGHKLGLGNFSRKGGGPLPWSVSHHNGRDADLAFYARTPNNKIAVPEHLYHFNHHLDASDAPEPMHFDTPANWALLKGLVTCGKHLDIQHLFMAPWLKSAVLEYAKKQKEKKEIILQVANLVSQPKKALTHNDHLHIRIDCPSDDDSDGCLSASRAGAAAIGQARGVRARLTALRGDLQAKSAQTRAGAAYLLGLYRDSDAVPHLEKLLRDEALAVRRAALLALLDWQPNGCVAAIDAAVEKESDPGQIALALRGLVQLDALELVQKRFVDQRVLPSTDFATPTLTVRQLAVDLLSESNSLGVARAVVALLDDKDERVREVARNTLGRITNHRTADLVVDLAGANLIEIGGPLPPEAEKSLWQRFFDGLASDTTAQDVALSGFALQGVALASLERTALPDLVRALRLPFPFRDNAARWIEKVAQYKPAVGRGSRSHPATFWPLWLVQKHMISASAIAAVTPASTGGGGLAADSD